MGWGALPNIGTEYGPCATECKHRDCAATKAAAAKPCRICVEPIGYETPYYNEDEGRMVHALCAQLEVEQEQKA